MPSPVKNRRMVSVSSESAKALNSEANPKIRRLPINSGLGPKRSPIGPAERAPTKMPVLDHRKAVANAAPRRVQEGVNAGPGRFQAWVKDGTETPIELTS